jgi:hypothetical protein
MPISSTALLIIAVVLVLTLGAAPKWNYSRSWGFWPSGALGTTLVIVVAFALLGYF